MFKDEVNSNDEHKLYGGVKRIVEKYAEDKKTIAAINEFTRVLCGGASLEEIMLIARDEGLNPTIASDITVDNECRLH